MRGSLPAINVLRELLSVFSVWLVFLSKLNVTPWEKQQSIEILNWMLVAKESKNGKPVGKKSNIMARSRDQRQLPGSACLPLLLPGLGPRASYLIYLYFSFLFNQVRMIVVCNSGLEWELNMCVCVTIWNTVLIILKMTRENLGRMKSTLVVLHFYLP